MSDLIPTITELADSPWLGHAAVDAEGRSGTVRRVYGVRGLEVAVLTAGSSGAGEAAIWAEPVELLSTSGRPAALPSFIAEREEFANLSARILYGAPRAEEITRYSELRDRLTPFLEAAVHLHTALIEQVEAGDRVQLLNGMFGRVVDPTPMPHLTLRVTMKVKLDERHLDEQPHLRERHPGGVVETSVAYLWPTLGLLEP